MVSWCLMVVHNAYSNGHWWWLIIDLLFSSSVQRIRLTSKQPHPCHACWVCVTCDDWWVDPRGCTKPMGYTDFENIGIAMRCSCCPLLSPNTSVSCCSSLQFSSTPANILGARLKPTQLVSFSWSGANWLASALLISPLPLAFSIDIGVFFCAKCCFVSFARTSNQTHGFC